MTAGEHEQNGQTNGHFDISKEQRDRFIEEEILIGFSKAQKESLRSRLTDLLDDYQGRDGDALVILTRASRVGRLDEYLSRLKDHFLYNLSKIEPQKRKMHNSSVVARTDNFIDMCYRDLDIIYRDAYH